MSKKNNKEQPSVSPSPEQVVVVNSVTGERMILTVRKGREDPMKTARELKRGKGGRLTNLAAAVDVR